MDKHDIELCYRIRQLRKEIPMNQSEFGEKIGVRSEERRVGKEC